MPSSELFVDADTGRIDTDHVLAEAVPIAQLVVLFGGLAFVPFAVTTLVGDALFLVLLTQFVLAVGTGVVLLYVVTRANQLANR